MSKLFSDEEFMAELRAASYSPAAMCRNTGLTQRGIYTRLGRLEKKGFDVRPPVRTSWAYPRIQRYAFDNGVMIVYADPHFGFGTPPTPAFKALLALCKALKPEVVVANGDIIDGASIKRFPNQGWEKLPKVADEIAEMQERQAQIRRAAGKAKLFRAIGNHDIRFDRFLSSQAESFDGLKGFRLSDHLPDWPGSWNLQVNDTVIRHRYRGGVHAARNNAIQAGVSVVTAHLHSQALYLLKGYRDRAIYGVQIPTLAEPPWDGPDDGSGPFEFTEDAPTDWVSGFGVLTYRNGGLRPPEFCQVVEGEAWFRGKVVT